ncbi:hypothetical protein Tco_1147435, partial [Tanacetum coccineum]
SWNQYQDIWQQTKNEKGRISPNNLQSAWVRNKTSKPQNQDPNSQNLPLYARKLQSKYRDDPTVLFEGNIYGDHVVSCAGIVGIKHWHNVVRDTLVDIYFLPGISAGKEVDIELSDGPKRKRVKYEAKCANIGSSFGELEDDAIALLKRIRKFSVTQDIGARAAVHIFSRVTFAIARGVGAQIVSRLPTTFCKSPEIIIK